MKIRRSDIESNGSSTWRKALNGFVFAVSILVFAAPQKRKRNDYTGNLASFGFSAVFLHAVRMGLFLHFDDETRSHLRFPFLQGKGLGVRSSCHGSWPPRSFARTLRMNPPATPGDSVFPFLRDLQAPYRPRPRSRACCSSRTRIASAGVIISRGSAFLRSDS